MQENNKPMQKIDFYRFIEKGLLQGASRYTEYWFCYDHTPAGSKVLDIGSGKSYLPKAVSTKPCEVVALEIDVDCTKYQLAQGIKTVCNTSNYPDGYFDVIISASSIEHFDPDYDGDIKMIEEAHRLLKDDGLFIVTLPVSSMYIKNRYAHTNHPPEKIYSKEEYESRFGKYFKEVVREIWETSNEQPTEYVPNASWRYVSTKRTDQLACNTFICAVWKNKCKQ